MFAERPDLDALVIGEARTAALIKQCWDLPTLSDMAALAHLAA